MTPRDIKAAAEIERLSFAAPWSEENIRDSFNSGCNRFFTAENEAGAVGYIGFTVAADGAYILNAAVRPDFRGQGAGRALVQKAISYAEQNGLAFVTLEVRPSNAPAVGLYSALGFERIGERRDYYSSPVENALLMTKYLRRCLEE